ncbi:MAG TPA: (d)CMP kinase [Smithellaceae bacterium]|nr:(d)CMP kinase [Smithellaceae bacterium]
MKAKVVTIDGPAGAGKSTVSKALAHKLGYLYLDTGALYRALALKALSTKIDLNDESDLTELCDSTDVRLNLIDGKLIVELDGVSVESRIRTEQVGKAASTISTFEVVRKKLFDLQRSAASRSSGIVAEGRDMATVVFPDADYKFYLDADLEERTRRRYLELSQAQANSGMDEVFKEMKARDAQDSGRKIAPLQKASDAQVIDSSRLTVPEVVDEILRRMNAEGLRTDENYRK